MDLVLYSAHIKAKLLTIFQGTKQLLNSRLVHKNLSFREQEHDILWL